MPVAHSLLPLHRGIGVAAADPAVREACPGQAVGWGSAAAVLLKLLQSLLQLRQSGFVDGAHVAAQHSKIGLGDGAHMLLQLPQLLAQLSLWSEREKTRVSVNGHNEGKKEEQSGC